MSKDKSLGFSRSFPPYISPAQVVDEAAYEVGPELFKACLGGGRTVVQIRHEKSRDPRFYQDERIEHTFVIRLTEVQVQKITVHESEPGHISRLPAPKVPWYAKVGKFLSAEWAAAGSHS